MAFFFANFPLQIAILGIENCSISRGRQRRWRMANQKRNIQMKFFRLGDHGRKGLILQHLRGNVIIGGLLQSGGVGILRYTEQVWLVAQGGHIGGVQGKLVLVHDVDQQMRQAEIFQVHIADVIVVGYVHFILVALAVRPGFCPIADLHCHRLRQGILPVKERLQLTLHLVDREYPFMEGPQNGDQHIGIMGTAS